MSWLRRIGALFTGAVLGVFVPAVAFASEHPALLAVADELARPRPVRRGFGFGAALAFCCLGVVVVVVVVVLLLMRNRRRG
jgi:hypothetical protein